MVTVEMAAALPVLMVLVLTGLFAVRAGDMQGRCVDAAREVARAAARDDPRAVELGRLALPGPASISVSRAAGTVTAVVTVRLRPAGGFLPSVTISAGATAAAEDATGNAPTAATGQPP